MPGGGVDGRIPDAMHKLPESGRAELEQRERQIDRRMIVEQPSRYRRTQSLCDRQFAGRRPAMKEEQFHKDG
jgi:hypothetical protein